MAMDTPYLGLKLSWTEDSAPLYFPQGKKLTWKILVKTSGGSLKGV